jgi:hypothetical protein
MRRLPFSSSIAIIGLLESKKTGNPSCLQRDEPEGARLLSKNVFVMAAPFSFSTLRARQMFPLESLQHR